MVTMVEATGPADRVHSLLSQTESNALATFLSQIGDSMDDSNNNSDGYPQPNELNLGAEWALYTNPSSTIFQMPKGREELARATRNLMELADGSNSSWAPSRPGSLPAPPPPFHSGPYPQQYLQDARNWPNITGFDPVPQESDVNAQRRLRSNTQVTSAVGDVSNGGQLALQQHRRQSTSSSATPRALVIPSTPNSYPAMDSPMSASSLNRNTPPDTSSGRSLNTSKRQRDSPVSDLSSNLHNLLYNTPSSTTGSQIPLQASLTSGSQEALASNVSGLDRSQLTQQQPRTRLQSRPHSHSVSRSGLANTAASSSQSPIAIAPSVTTTSSTLVRKESSKSSRAPIAISSRSHTNSATSTVVPVKLATKLDTSASSTSTSPSSSTNKPSLLTADQKKQNHIHSEQKRRANIRKGYEALCEVIPPLRDAIRAEEAACASTPGKKRGRGRLLGEDGEKMDGRAGPRSESVVLQKTIEHITELAETRSSLEERMKTAINALPPGHPALAVPRLSPSISTFASFQNLSSAPHPRPWEIIWDGGVGLPMNENGEQIDDGGDSDEDGD